jgi:catalase
MDDKTKRPFLTHASGAPVTDNVNIMTAWPRGPALLQDIWLLEKLAHFHREVIPERRMHAKGTGAHGTFTVTHDITRYTNAKIFSKIGGGAEHFFQIPLIAARQDPSAADAPRWQSGHGPGAIASTAMLRMRISNSPD